jgi:molybdopterin-guanine dinucleotide biosynthesis protein A
MILREAVILAGGRSSRMGTDKALLVVDGKTMLERQIDRLATRFERVIVSRAGDGDASVLDGAPPPRIRVDFVCDSRPGSRGPLAGIEAGLDAIEGDRALFVAVDTADIDLALVARLESEAEGCPGVVPLWRERIQGAFAIYSRALLPAVREMLDRGDGRLGDLAGVDGVVTMTLDEGVEHVFRSLNTPQEFEAWRRSVEGA